MVVCRRWRCMATGGSHGVGTHLSQFSIYIWAALLQLPRHTSHQGESCGHRFQAGSERHGREPPPPPVAAAPLAARGLAHRCPVACPSTTHCTSPGLGSWLELTGSEAGRGRAEGELIGAKVNALQEIGD